MAELQHVRRFVALGLAAKTDNCVEEPPNHFSIFLDLNHPSVSNWMNSTMTLVEDGKYGMEESKDEEEGLDDEEGGIEDEEEGREGEEEGIKDEEKGREDEEEGL